MGRNIRFLSGILEEEEGYLEEKGEREEFEEEESRLARVLGVLEAVPDDIGVGDEARLVQVL